MSSFAEAKAEFDARHQVATHTPCVVPVRGKPHPDAQIRNARGEPTEQYYKWQFVNALISSGLYAKDYIGVEVHFPKGNVGSTALQLDAAIFDDPTWVEVYNRYWLKRLPEDLQWLNDHLLGVVEFKRKDKTPDKVFSGQVKPAMKEKEPSSAYVLGVYYDAERLFLFHRRGGRYLRYDESKNQKGELSGPGDLCLHLPDPYVYMPSFEELRDRVHKPTTLDRSKRGIKDLEVITTIASVQIQTAFSEVLRALDKAGLVNQRGYSILIQTLALKIFDEKRNEKTPHHNLGFYVSDDEAGFHTLAEPAAQQFIARTRALRDAAATHYQKILKESVIEWKNAGHVRAVAAICKAFQDYSFVRSAKSDLYQLVFYNFANSFKRDEAAQFLTPLPVIDFIVKIVNPRDGERVFDPCCGIGDFLSLSFVNSLDKAESWRLDDANIYGMDLDENMTTLATLNMLLNGDGEAKLFDRPDKGSILTKVAVGNQLVDLIPDQHHRGDWDTWPDETRLLKFDVVLTNPPFGEDRAFRVKSDADRRLIESYELWHLTRQRADDEDPLEAKGTGAVRRGKAPRSAAKGSDALDLGVVFLENAYRVLGENGRLGIVLSNSIASINRWERVRTWLMERMRLVAFFDLPSNVFAETGVNTSILIAYKPPANVLKRMNAAGYKVFVRDIKRVGYEKRTSKRNVFFNPVYRIDDRTFETQVDAEGRPVLDEEFSDTINSFRQWALTQEEPLQRLFVKEG